MQSFVSRKIEARAKVRRAVREWFEGQGFLEVETPARVPSPGQEVHLEAIPAGEGRYLITSPEYHMKRLVAAGLPRIVQICRCWRAEERGSHHEPEFTMIEWYRASASLDEIARDCEAIIAVAARAAGHWPVVDVPASRGREGKPEPLTVEAPFQRLTVREALARFAGLGLRGDESVDELRGLAMRAGCNLGSAASWNAMQAGTTAEYSKLRVISILSKAEVTIVCWYRSDARAWRERCRLLGQLVLRISRRATTAVAVPSSASLTR